MLADWSQSEERRRRRLAKAAQGATRSSEESISFCPLRLFDWRRAIYLAKFWPILDHNPGPLAWLQPVLEIFWYSGKDCCLTKFSIVCNQIGDQLSPNVFIIVSRHMQLLWVVRGSFWRIGCVSQVVISVKCLNMSEQGAYTKSSSASDRPCQ